MRVERMGGREVVEKVDDDPRQPTPTVGHPFLLLAFSSSIEERRTATVREVTTFFRFSRGGRVREGWVVAGAEEKSGKRWRKAEAGLLARAEGRARGAREARERGDIDEGTGRQVMIYRGKFPEENYTQTRPADLPLRGNRLSFFP